MAAIKVAIVTGGAAGIGFALTKHLVGRGYRVVIADIDGERGAQAQREIGNDALFVQCDVADWDSQAALFKRAFEWGGSRIDLFAANAGVAEKQSIYELPDGPEPAKPNLKLLDVNLVAVFYGLRLYRHYARVSGAGGKMIVTSSSAGLYPFPIAPMYAAAKHGIVGLVRGAATKLLRDENVALNAICPGPVDTGIDPGMDAVIPRDKFTPLSVICAAYDKLIDENITGQAVECSNTTFYLRPAIDYADDCSRFLNEEILDEDKFDKFYDRPKEQT
ncbi:putative 15-hydroxyprostaglandin dehydrogenase protein [Neofusicoccum parvum UCRNP2]|uniref:Putative 15-hydroxyprostaglandin dehydrogenase protein n=1 Tax=Botryosphaeria parva (strain UCR-NP2) TaxID=1287680 RepID=R1GDD6_BOTPV|nr:putative 15-hydroxyprostaglandin dehydrogenase protein [Neofusicoccum parvum UCRNP2]